MATFSRNIAKLRARGVERANEQTRSLRSAFITSLPGQEMIYLRKETEARAYVADPDPNPLDYPFLIAETGNTAPTTWEVAQVFLNMAAQWSAVGSQLESARLSAIYAIQAATTPTEIDSALAALTDALSAMQT